MSKTAISPTREENYPEWYQQVIKEAELAETSPARGCMVIKPWGYGIWENVQASLDKMIKDTGHENAYFPLFIPLSLMEKEAKHVAGFAKECAVVTHHRLEERDGKLIPSPDAELEEPLVVRPTSETVIGEVYSKWVQSYRDLPLLINQWANVVRWEMRPRLFLRTAEFLWQEGHTVHASDEEAREEVSKMLDVYACLCEEFLAIPVIKGEKTEGERFPGAVETLCIEAMMQDKKALQAGTSHYLGQNFSKAAGIKFLNKAGEQEFGYTTSWGVSTRLVGAMIMAHSDDNGLRVPPRVAPKQIVIVPVIPKDNERENVLSYAEKVKEALQDCTAFGKEVSVHIDKRDIRGGDKNWQWIKKGAPLRVEVGPKDAANNKVVLYRRDCEPKDKNFLALQELPEKVGPILQEIQSNYFNRALKLQKENTFKDISSKEELIEFFKGPGGFAEVPWSEDLQAEKEITKHKLTVRCIPLGQEESPGKCIWTGNPSKRKAIIAKAY